MTRIWLFEIDDADSELRGEQFLVELEDAQKTDAFRYARKVFPDVHLSMIAEITQEEAEKLNLSRRK